METSQQDSSYSEFFRELREEANSYISAKRPMASLRKPSTGIDTQVEVLQRENEELRTQVRFLEQDNLRLRTYCAELEDSVRRLTEALRAASQVQTECAELGDCSSLSESEDDVLLVPLNIASPVQEQSRGIIQSQSDLVSRLRQRVKKHQTFIQHMKRSLEQLLQDRLRERAEHLRTKTKLANLIKSFNSAVPDDARKFVSPGN